MKYLIRLVLLFILLYASYQDTYAYTFEVNGINYRTTSSTECEVIYKKDYSGDIIIPSSVQFTSKLFSVTAIGDSAFYRCNKVTSVTLPNSIKSIGEYAFFNCPITSIEIPNHIISIGTSAFCLSNLASVNIPNSVVSIGSHAFLGCEMTSVIIPRSVNNLGYGVFQRCNNLISIHVDNDNTIYDSRDDCNAIIETSSNTLIEGCNSTVIPKSVTTIGQRAFCERSNITTISIPDNVTSIAEHAFGGCSGLTSITIPNSVTTIGEYAFSGLWRLTSVTIPNSVISIGKSAFGGNTSVETIIIGENVEYIDTYALDMSRFLVDVFCYAKNPPEATNAFYYAEYGIGKKLMIGEKTVLHVPEGSVEAYKSTFPWSKFRYIEAIGASPQEQIIGEWKLVSKRGFTHNFVEYKSDGTFSFTSTNDPSYEEHGEYKIEDEFLYMHFSDEPQDDWATSKILILNNMSLVLHDYEDGYSYGNPYAYSKQNPNPPSSINPLLIGKWELESPNGPIHTHLELKEDGTFSYTSAYDDYYEEHGEYRIEGDLFYKLFSDEIKWNFSKIVDLTENSLILGNLDDDYITVYKEYKYKKVSGSSGINSPASIPEINAIYSVEGIKNATPQKGINIIKMSDGTIKKVLIK